MNGATPKMHRKQGKQSAVASLKCKQDLKRILYLAVVPTSAALKSHCVSAILKPQISAIWITDFIVACDFTKQVNANRNEIAEMYSRNLCQSCRDLSRNYLNASIVENWVQLSNCSKNHVTNGIGVNEGLY